jgi:hypothetical protein
MFYIAVLAPCNDNKYEILLRNMGGITLDIISRIKKYPRTLFTVINDRNGEGGRMISTVPHLGHNYGYRLFCEKIT